MSLEQLAIVEKNFTFVSGARFEDALKYIQEQQVRHKILQEPTPGNSYFRSSKLRVPSEFLGPFIDHFGNPLHEEAIFGRHVENDLAVRIWHGLYTIGPQFYKSLSGYSGRITLEKGKLVEEVRVAFFYPEFGMLMEE